MNTTQRLATGSALIVTHEVAKLFVFNNKYRKITFTASGADIVLTAGMIIGTIAASGKGKILASASTDGSQFPTGICAETITVTDGTSKDVTICISGDVAESKVILDGSDTLATPIGMTITVVGTTPDETFTIGSRTIRDRLACDTLGICLVAGDELSEYDNY